jgi:hypothetical protein
VDFIMDMSSRPVLQNCAVEQNAERRRDIAGGGARTQAGRGGGGGKRASAPQCDEQETEIFHLEWRTATRINSEGTADER